MSKKKTAAGEPAASSVKKPAAKRAPIKKTAPVESPEKAQNISPETNPIETQETEISIKAVAIPDFAIVIPFRADKAKGTELIYAIRAWEKNLPGNISIIVVGDSLPSFSDRVIHIPHKPVSDNPQVDVASKMAAAIASDRVPEVFVWSNDDIYPVSTIELADLLVLKAMGPLGLKGSSGSVYRENSERTVKALKDAGIDKPFDFACHTPVVFFKDKLAETLALFKCTKEGHLVSSLYYNTHHAGVRPIITRNDHLGSIVASVFKANPNKSILDRIFSERKFVNHNDAGWPAVQPYLAKLFPEKSVFEK